MRGVAGALPSACQGPYSLTPALYIAGQVTWASDLGFFLTQVPVSCLWWGRSEKINPDLVGGVSNSQRKMKIDANIIPSLNVSAHSVDLFPLSFLSDHDNDLSNSRRYFAFSWHHLAPLPRLVTSALLFFFFLFSVLLGFTNDPYRTAKKLLLSSHSSEVETPI